MKKKSFSFFGIFGVLIIILLGVFVWAAAAPTALVFTQNTVANYDTDGTVHLNWTANSGGGDISYVIYIYQNDILNNNSANHSATGFIFTNTTDANYTFTVEAENGTSPTKVNSTNISIIIDLTVPVIELKEFTNLTAKKNTENITLNISLSDATAGLTGSVCLINVGNGANKSVVVNSTNNWCNTTGINLTGLADGNQIINIYVNDTATNLGLNNSFFVSVDTTAPSPSLTKTSSGASEIILAISGKDGTCTVNRGSASISGNTITETGLSCGKSFNYIITCTDSAGNVGSSTEISPSTTSCSGTSDSGDGSPKTTKSSGSFDKITPGVASIMKNFDSETGIKEIQINVNNEAQNVKITVTKHDGKPAAVSVEKTGIVYQYIQIDVTNLGNNLDKANVQFRVEKSWISSNGLDKDKISVFKFNEGTEEWDELSTIYNNSDNTYDFFDVELTSFSYFAISEKTVVVVEEEEDAGVVGDILEKAGITKKDDGSRSLVWLWILIGVFVVGLYLFMNKKNIFSKQ